MTYNVSIGMLNPIMPYYTVITRFADSIEQPNIQTLAKFLYVNKHYKMSPLSRTTCWFVDTHTDRQTRRKQYQFLLSWLVKYNPSIHHLFKQNEQTYKQSKSI